MVQKRVKSQMGKVIHLGDPPIEVTIRRKKNARRLTLRLASDGVFLTLPIRTPIAEAEAFALKQENWLREKLAKRPTVQTILETGCVPIFGQQHQIETGSGKVCKIVDGTLQVPGPETRQISKIMAFLKETARAQLTQASDKYAAAINMPYSKITLRDTRSRWGSCTSTGNLMYSWRLVMAPPEVLDYVAAHEVAHLKEMNHSPQYWSIVAGICPDYQIHRAWLRQNGAALHRIDFKS